MTTSLNGVWRAGLLFTAGATFTLVHRLLFLQRQSKLGLKHYDIDALLAIEDWWVAPVVGAVAAALGLVCPILERKVGKWTTVPVPEWTGVLRCSAFFVGISHASAKVDYPSTFQLALTLAALCAALWWCFDRSISGLGAGLAVAIVAALITHFYVIKSHNGLIAEEWKLWIPYVFFSGGVTMVILGRHLASISYPFSCSGVTPSVTKVHNE